jgi:hypothetical protein
LTDEAEQHGYRGRRVSERVCCAPSWLMSTQTRRQRKTEDATRRAGPINGHEPHFSHARAKSLCLPSTARLHSFSARSSELFSQQPAPRTLRAHTKQRPTQTLHDLPAQVWQTPCRPPSALALLSPWRRSPNPSALPTGACTLQVYVASAA